jgi:hypothetical protein
MGSDRVNSTGSEAWQVLPFANALTAATAVFSVALRAVRDLFTVVFNSQFLGANVASLSPPQPGIGSSLGTLLVVVTWVFGAVWAVLYNRWAR